jgi:hypothetical protein
MPKRYHIPEAWPEERDNGSWVKWEDHQKAISTFEPPLYGFVTFAGKEYQVCRIAAKATEGHSPEFPDEACPAVIVKVMLVPFNKEPENYHGKFSVRDNY